MATLGEVVTAQAWATLTQIGALEAVTYTRLPAPVRNLETGQTTASATTYAVFMLVRGYRRHEVDGTAVVAGDLLARIPHAELAVVPTTRDTVTYQGIVWSIVAVEEGADGAWWRLTLRRVRPV